MSNLDTFINQIGGGINFKKVFGSEGETEEQAFSALSEAEAYLKENDFSFGSTQRGKPLAVSRTYEISGKWDHLLPEEKKDVDGFLYSDVGSMRNGPIYLYLKFNPEVNNERK